MLLYKSIIFNFVFLEKILSLLGKSVKSEAKDFGDITVNFFNILFTIS